MGFQVAQDGGYRLPGVGAVEDGIFIFVYALAEVLKRMQVKLPFGLGFPAFLIAALGGTMCIYLAGKKLLGERSKIILGA